MGHSNWSSINIDTCEPYSELCRTVTASDWWLRPYNALLLNYFQMLLRPKPSHSSPSRIYVSGIQKLKSSTVPQITSTTHIYKTELFTTHGEQGNVQRTGVWEVINSIMIDRTAAVRQACMDAQPKLLPMISQRQYENHSSATEVAAITQL
jgi:hypothetical protein